MALPVITSISPGSGPAGGGTAIAIHGTGFTGATAVLFGGAEAIGVTVKSAKLIDATAPAGTGTVNVTVTTPSGSSASVAASQFTYTVPAATANGSPPFVDPGLSAELVANLLNVLTSATSPDAVEAQNIIMRRIALEGDVIGSRIPNNFMTTPTGVGAVLNYLTSQHETAIRQQALAGMLGVAGPSQPLGWISNVQPLAMVDVTNDRPAGPAQPTIPLAVLVRSDFVSGLKAAIDGVHQQGATLPFASPPVIQLPMAAPGATPPADILRYLGRELDLAPAAALAAPATDPLAIVRPAGSSQPWQIAARVLAAAPVIVPPADYDAIQCTPTSNSTVKLTQARLVPLGPPLASAGFYPATPLPPPANSTETAWAACTNITGLISGTTRLGDELSLLYSAETIASSVFAAAVGWVWNGSAFAGS
jgi:IPT/TIG domain